LTLDNSVDRSHRSKPLLCYLLHCICRLVCRFSDAGNDELATRSCENCSHTLIAYNSCRNRHCPKCQGAAAREWLAEREAEFCRCGPAECAHQACASSCLRSYADAAGCGLFRVVSNQQNRGSGCQGRFLVFGRSRCERQRPHDDDREQQRCRGKTGPVLGPGGVTGDLRRACLS
jgi:hypothetical protein